MILTFIFVFFLTSLAGCEKDVTEVIIENNEVDVFDVTVEPPLTEKDLAYPLPDFLNEDQQLQYRRAKSVYSRLFSGSSGIAYGDVDGYGNEYEHYTIDDCPYTYISNIAGRYRDYLKFEKLIKSVFIDEFWEKRNILGPNAQYPLYANCDGYLCYIDFGPTGGFAANQNFYDEFELISKIDTEINFYVIGHYSWRYQIGNETIEQRDQRLKDTYEYTKKFLITMVLTDDGWRFSEFSDTVTDEGNYEGIY